MNTPFPDVIDNSLVESFIACPTKCWQEYFQHWKPATPNVHLHAGGAYAHGLEAARLAFFRDGRAEPEAIAVGAKALIEFYGDFECPPDSAKSLEGTLGAFEFYFDRYPMRTDTATPVKLAGGKTGVEFNFVEPLDVCHPVTGVPLLYTGRFDQLCDFQGGIYGEDDKTTTQLGASWSRKWDLRSQFTGYCLLPETEVLTPEGWVRLDKLQPGIKVAQWDKDGTMQWVVPTEIHSPEYHGNMISCDGKVSFVSTPEHRQVVWDTYSNRWKDYTSETLPKRSGALRFMSAGKLEGGETVNPNFVRLLVAIQADGSWRDGGVRFGFSKERKIERLLRIIDDLGIECRWHKDEDYRVQFAHEWVDRAKRLLGDEKKFGSWLLGWSQESLQVFIEEVGYWDGSVRENRGWMYFSIDEENAEWVRTVAAVTGHYSSVGTQEGWKSDNPQFRVNITEGCQHSPHLHSWKEVKYEGKVYCLTVPSSYFLIRHKGRTMVTGNCWGAKKHSLPIMGFLVRGVSILKTKYDTQQAITYRQQWQIDEWYDNLNARVLPEMIRMWEEGKWRMALGDACEAYGGCPFRQVCLAEPENRISWLETKFERRRWDPVTRVETTL